MECPDFSNILQNCKGHTLIMPAISVSNAGQLAIDLLIQSSCAEKVGNVWHEAFISLIGAHPYKDESTDLCTEFEIYEVNQSKVLFLQFRSPLWQNKEEGFVEDLLNWFTQMKFEKVIIMSSVYDYERKDNQIRDSRVRYCLCPLTQTLATTFTSLKCKYMESSEDSGDESGVMTKETCLPGAGFTKNLHLKCIEKKLPCVSLFKFCSDGDNTPEAAELANLVDGWLNIIPGDQSGKTKLVPPPSWRYIFGGPSPQELFP